jgi:catabolite regulation protein CreA
MKTKYRVLTAALLASAALAGCGGDSGGDFNGNGNGGGNANACDTSTIAGVTCYINNLIATATLETNDPADISGVTLATDETSDSSPNP